MNRLVGIFAVMFFAALPARAPAQMALARAGSLSTLNYPVASVVADFNGDGIADVAIVQYGDNSVAVALGNGDGTFQAPTNYAVGAQPIALTAGDFNKDGVVDLAVVNTNDKTVSILIGTGSGTGTNGFIRFSAAAVGNAPSAIAAAHLSASGNLDLVVANSADNTVSILRGTGSGFFLPQTTFAVGTFPAGLALADVNGDQHVDIVTANGAANSVSVLLGNGDATFGAATAYATAQTPGAVAVADFNGDGKPDLAVATYGGVTSGAVSILLGNGNGTFAAHTDFATENGSRAIVVADFNRDGIADLAVVNYFAQSLSLLQGVGDGTFGAQRPFATGPQPYALAVGDIDGDGVSDILVPNRLDNSVSVFIDDVIFANTFER